MRFQLPYVDDNHDHHYTLCTCHGFKHVKICSTDTPCELVPTNVYFRQVDVAGGDIYVEEVSDSHY